MALSSAESELYAICAGVNEGLHVRNFLLDSNICSKLNLRIHTDSAQQARALLPDKAQANEHSIDMSVEIQDAVGVCS